MKSKETAGTRNTTAAERLDLSRSNAEGQAVFETANLRPEKTGLPFVVLISQEAGARHDVRVKIARAAKVRPSGMITVAIRPGVRVVRGELSARELDLLTQWMHLNRDVLADYWNGVVEYTEDALNALKPIDGTRA